MIKLKYALIKSQPRFSIKFHYSIIFVNMGSTTKHHKIILKKLSFPNFNEKKGTFNMIICMRAIYQIINVTKFLALYFLNLAKQLYNIFENVEHHKW